MPSLSEIRESASFQLDKVKSSMGMQQTKLNTADSGGEESNANNSEGSSSSTMLDELSDLCPELTYQQRIMGFAICFSVGYIISFMSFSFFVELVNGNPLPFVLLYTVGNILSLLSSMFLCGPKRQFKNMFDKKRKWTSIVYLSCVILTLIVCFIPFEERSKLLVLILLVITQCCASLWYSLSYIPFGRRAVKRCFRDTLGLDDQV